MQKPDHNEGYGRTDKKCCCSYASKNVNAVKSVLHGIARPGEGGHICPSNAHPQHET